MSFGEYLNANYNEKLDDLTKFLISDAFKAGAQSRQAEVDELQKKIDEALKYVSESPLKDVSRKAMLNFLDILKGTKND